MIVNDMSGFGFGAYGDASAGCDAKNLQCGGDWIRDNTTQEGWRQAWEAHFGRKRDEWENWCDRAGQTWGEVKGNWGEADVYTRNCWRAFDFKNEFAGGPGLLSAPWTDVGLPARGLPYEFSPNPAVVRAGAAGKAEQKAKDTFNPPAVTPDPISTKSKAEATGAAKMMTEVSLNTTKGTTASIVIPVGTRGGYSVQAQTDAAAQAAVDRILAAQAAALKPKTGLIVGAVAAVGLGVFLLGRKKSGGAVAGYAGYKRPRKSRRSRR